MGLVRTLWTSKSGGDAATTVGRAGEMWYDSSDGILRLSNGVIPGGIIVGGYGGGSSIAVFDHGTILTPGATSFNFTGTGVTVTAVGSAINVNIASSTGSGIIYVGNFDGGQPNSNYGGITSVDAGGVLG